MKLAAPTLDALVVERPEPTAERPQHLCLDAGYDDDLPRDAAERRRYVAHIRPRGEDRANAGSPDPLKKPRHWVVERLHSWLNRSRRLLVRWEKLERTYLAFVQLACALICFQHCALAEHDRCCCLAGCLTRTREYIVMPEQKRTRLEGVYMETPAVSIDLPFTLANYRALLIDGARPDGRYTHQQIKTWADQFWWTQSEQPFDLGVDVAPEVKEAADLAQEIEMQWDMYLANSYTLQQLQRLDFSQVRLPTEWFADWLARLNELAPPTVSE
jgi:transposase